MNKRNVVFFCLVLIVVGLSIVLIIARITNKIVIASSNVVIENSLKKVEEDSSNDEFNHYIELGGLEKDYTKIELSSINKIEINSQIQDSGMIEKIIELREYVDAYYHLCFKNGGFDDSQMLDVVLSSFASEGIKKIDINDIDDVSLELFDKKINFEKTLYSVEDGKITNTKINFKGNYILKINEVYKLNNEDDVYDVYIDDIYPANGEKEKFYSNPNVIDYMNSQVVNTYKLRVKKVSDNHYVFLGAFCYNFKY